MTKSLTYIVIISLIMFIRCAGIKPLVQQQKPVVTPDSTPFHPNAVERFIQGCVNELRNDHKSALLNFQEALLYDSSSATIYNKVAEQYIRLKKIDSAEKFLQTAVNRFPENIDTRRMLASIYWMQRDLVRAEKEFNKILELNPADVESRNFLITIYIARKQDLKVAEQYEKIIELGFGNEELLIKAGDIYLNNQLFSKSEQLFKILLNEYPDDERSFLAMAKLSLARGDTTLAKQWYRKGIETNIDFQTCVEELRDIYITQKNWDAAIVLLKQVIEKDESKIENYLRLGELYYQQQDTSAALVQFLRTVELFPEDFRGYFSLGRVYFQQAEWTAAEHYLKKSIALNQRFEFGWIWLGFVYVRANRLQDAEDHYRKAVELFPNTSRLHYFMGSILHQQKKSEEAIQYLAKSLELDQENVDAMGALAMIYDDKKIYHKSDSLYQEALKIEPDDPLLLNNYSYSLSVRGINLEEAMEMSQRAVAADSTNGAYLDTLGWIYFKMGDYQTARKYISRAAEVRDNSAEVWEHLGDVYEKLGDLESAKIYWKKSLELDSSRSWLLKKMNEDEF